MLGRDCLGLGGFGFDRLGSDGFFQCAFVGGDEAVDAFHVEAVFIGGVDDGEAGFFGDELGAGVGVFGVFACADDDEWLFVGVGDGDEAELLAVLDVAVDSQDGGLLSLC